MALRELEEAIRTLQKRQGELQSTITGLLTALPAPKTAYADADVGNVSAAAATWQNIPGAVVSFTPERPLWVRIEYSAEISTTSTGTYGMIGAACSGGLSLVPEADYSSGKNPAYGLTPFTTNPDHTGQLGTKTVKLPAGVTTTIQMQKRRNTTGATPAVNYAVLHVTPIDWASS